VLESLLLLGGRRAGEDLEAAVHLKRVCRDRDRVLAALPQPLGDLDGHGSLAHARGAEDRYHAVRPHHDR
jgi:hypothetical protein